MGDDPELEAIKQRVGSILTSISTIHTSILISVLTSITTTQVRAMEEESEKLRQLQSEVGFSRHPQFYPDDQ